MANVNFTNEYTVMLNGDSVEKDISALNELQQKLEKNDSNYINGTSVLKVFVSNESDFTDTRIANIKAVLKVLSKQHKSINVIIVSNTEKRNIQTNTPYIYSNKEINQLIELNNSIKEFGIKDIEFSENFSDTWSFITVLKANEKLNSIIRDLKKANLSPYETMILIHKIASNFTYRDSKNNSKESPRCLPGVFEKGDIVCVGYAHFVKAIIDNLNMPGLKAEINSFALYGREQGYYAGAHANNRIIIQDNKYNIHGAYLEDSCWDGANEKHKSPRGYAHCMYLEDELTHLKKYFVSKNVGLSMKSLDTTYTIAAYRYGEEFDDDEIVIPEPLILAESGKQISLNKFKEAYKSVLLKTTNFDFDEIEYNIEKTIAISAKHALDTFSAKSENVFYQEAIRNNYYPLMEGLNNTNNAEINRLI